MNAFDSAHVDYINHLAGNVKLALFSDFNGQFMCKQLIGIVDYDCINCLVRV